MGSPPTPASPSVLIVDHQHDLALDPARWGAFAGAVLADLGVPATAEVAVTFVDRDAIAALHREHLGLDGPTDVLSFPVDGEGAASALVDAVARPADTAGADRASRGDGASRGHEAARDGGARPERSLGAGRAVLAGDPLLPAGDEPWLLGDVVVCPAVAQAQAAAHAGSLDDELALLVVHGLLHLLGLDHLEVDDRAVMWTWERELLGRHHGPLGGDPWSG